jgi:alkylation response protein AidB-like acyl-CoA dehydrogenase
MDVLNEGRAEIANQAIGLARGAYDRAVSHAKSREQFGQKIGKFQNISHLIVEISENIESAALLVYKAGRSYGQEKKVVVISCNNRGFQVIKNFLVFKIKM